MRFLPAAWVLAACLALAGCADDKMADVKGTVKLDGKEIDGGSILFTAVDGSTPVSGGPIQAGRYAVRAYRGKMQVKINFAKVVGKRALYGDDAKAPTKAVVTELIPARYNDETTLEIDVKAGVNEKDFDLKSE